MNKEKSILFIERGLLKDKGGVEKSTYIISLKLKEIGYKVFFAYTYNNDDEIEEREKIYFSIEESYSSLKKKFGDFIVRNDITTIICQNVQGPKFCKLYESLKKEHNIYLISCLHANPDIWINKNKIKATTLKIYVKELLRTVKFHIFGNPYKKRIIDMYNVSDKYVILSDSFKKIIASLYKIKGEKLVTIPNPCSFDYQYNYDIKTKENIILVVSRMAEQQKRISNILYIWKRLYKLYPSWQLVLIGDGSDIDNYKNYVKNNNIERVNFKGQLSNVEKYYQKAKIFLMTSIWEGQPMTLIESMHNGCVPVVFDTFASVHDLIKNKKNGIIIKYANINDFIHETRALMDSDEKIAEMGEQAIKSINETYNTEFIIKRWINIIK